MNCTHPGYSYESKFIEIKGSKIHYIEEGEGNPILFIHGMPSWSYLWRNVIPHVKIAGRCIALDLIGFGKSDSPDIEFRIRDHLEYLSLFIKALDLKDLKIIGHSWGAVLGTLYAKENESNVKAISYIEPMLGEWKKWSDFNPHMPAMQEIFKKFRSPEGWNLIVNDNFFMEKMFINASIRTLSEDERNAYLEPFRDISRRKALWRAPQELPIENEPPDVSHMVNSVYNWMISSTIPQLFFYTTPAAFFTAEKRERLLNSASNIISHSLGDGRYNHIEDYSEEIGHVFASWLLAQNKETIV